MEGAGVGAGGLSIHQPDPHIAVGGHQADQRRVHTPRCSTTSGFTSIAQDSNHQVVCVPCMPDLPRLIRYSAPSSGLTAALRSGMQASLLFETAWRRQHNSAGHASQTQRSLRT